MDKSYLKECMKISEAISKIAIIAYTDHRGKITYANDNFCKISGYKSEELIGQDHHILNSGYHSKDFFKNMYADILEGKIWRSDIRNKKKDGSFYWVDTQVIPIFNDDNKIESILSIRFDITERKMMEESIINMEKMATMGELSAIVAHEINNPLTVIDLSATTLIRDLNKLPFDQKTLEKHIHIIIKSSAKISKIVRGLKTISRKSAKEEFVSINLKNYLDETLSFSIHKCKNANIDLKIVLDTNDLIIDCRPDEIAQVLINLINNSFDAILELKERPRDPWIELLLISNKEENYITFSVRDCGLGVPAEISDKILTPFFTTKAFGKGTGLGLSVSKTIIEDHSGEFGINKNDMHTHFYFKVPIKQNTPT